MLTPEDARILNRLTLGGAPMAMTISAGAHRSRVRGAGIDFEEHRPYQPGDDPRTIDWTIEARLQQLVVRTARARGDARLHVLVDVSRSMTIGSPTKLACARRIAAALAHVAVTQRDSVSLSLVDDRLRLHVATGSGRGQWQRIRTVLDAATSTGPSDLARAVEACGGLLRGPALAVVISDFLDEGAGVDALRILRHQGLTPMIVQVLAPEDLAPTVGTSSLLLDIEHPAAPAIPVTPDAVAAYLERLRAHLERLRTFGLAHRLAHARLSPTDGFRSQLSGLAQAGILTAC